MSEAMRGTCGTGTGPEAVAMGGSLEQGQASRTKQDEVGSRKPKKNHRSRKTIECCWEIQEETGIVSNTHPSQENKNSNKR